MTFVEKLWNNWNQPQLFSLIVVTFLICTLSVVLYFQIKKTKKDKAPSTIVFLAEQYYNLVDSIVEENAHSRLNKVKPYIFTLFTFLLIGNLISLVGIEPIGSTTSITLTLGFMTWLGIYVIGIAVQKFSFFKKYKNPLEIISIPAPLISLSFRLFGNIVGGSTILILLFYLFQSIWNLIPLGPLNVLNLPAVVLFPPFLFYLDVFDTLIQSYVFTLLTTVYWAESSEKPEKKSKKIKKTKSAVAQI